MFMEQAEYDVLEAVFTENFEALEEEQEREIKTKAISMVRSIASKYNKDLKKIMEYIGLDNLKKLADIRLKSLLPLHDEDIKFIIYKSDARELLKKRVVYYKNNIGTCATMDSMDMELFPILAEYIINNGHAIDTSKELSLQIFSSLFDMNSPLSPNDTYTIFVENLKSIIELNREVIFKDYELIFYSMVEESIKNVLQNIEIGLTDEQIYTKVEEDENEEDAEVKNNNIPKP